MKIDRNIPIPAPAAPQPKKARVPVENMEVGDSILFPAGTKRQTAASTCHATAMKARLKMKFKSAAEGDAVRVWRTA